MAAKANRIFFIIFAILKLFFFPDFLKQKAEAGQEQDYVASELVGRKAP